MNKLSQDGVHSMVPRDKMSPAARKLRDTYAIKSGTGTVASHESGGNAPGDRA